MTSKAMIFLVSLLCMGLFGFTHEAPNTQSQIVVKHMVLYDAAENRNIPVALYLKKTPVTKVQAPKSKMPIVIMSHGYGAKNTHYSFLAHKLATEGYFVASIQHQLRESSIPIMGSYYENRKPIWDLGVKNIHFVFQELKRIEPNSDPKKLTLIGHSMGGDISLMFANKYPNLVSNIVSLDSLRIPIPKTHRFKIFYLRANDTKADAGVIPTKAEQQKFGIKVIELKNARHVDLSDIGSETLKQEINNTIIKFLEER